MIQKLVFLFFILLSFFGTAQKPYVKIEVENKDVAVGEEFLFMLQTNIDGAYDMDFPSVYSKGGVFSESIRESLNYNTGYVERLHVIQQSGMFTKKGTYTFGPAYIKKNGKVYKSNTIKINVLDPASISLKTPKFDPDKTINVKIESNKASYYEGEPILLNANIITKFQPIKNGIQYSSYTFDDKVDEYPLDLSLSAVFKKVKLEGKPFYETKIDNKLVFPSGVGYFKINGFTSSFSDGFNYYNAKSAGKTILIKPLPSGVPSDFVGIVGEINLEVKVDKTNFKEGETCQLSVILSGSGNLHNAEKPIVKINKDFNIYGDPTRTDELTFTKNGAEGSITYTYNLQALKDGPLLLEPISVSYFSINDEQYKTLKSESVKFDIVNDPKFKNTNDTTVKNNALINADNLNPMMQKELLMKTTHYSQYLNTFIILLSFLLLSLIYLIIKNKKPSEKVIEEKKVLKQRAQIYLEEAQKEFEEGNTSSAYGKLLKYMIEVSKTKLQISEISPGKDQLLHELKESKTTKEVIEKFDYQFVQFQEISYGFPNDQHSFENDLRSVQQTMKNIKP